MNIHESVPVLVPPSVSIDTIFIPSSLMLTAPLLVVLVKKVQPLKLYTLQILNIYIYIYIYIHIGGWVSFGLVLYVRCCLD